MRVLVLSGGSSKGSFSVGCLKHLLFDLEIKYDAICGISVGAIIAAWLASYPHGQEKECIIELEKLWKTLKTSDIYIDWINLPKPLNYIGYVAALWKPSLYNSQPLMNLIKYKYDAEKIKSSGKKLRIGAVSLNTGEYREFTENCPYMIDAILASSSFPGAFCPIEIDGQLFSDGGIKTVTPLETAISLGATEIDVIITSPKKTVPDDFNTNFNMIKLGPRIVDIMSDEIINQDLSTAISINELIKSGIDIPGQRYIDIRVFRPKEILTKNSLIFEQSVIRPMIDKGYEIAREVTGC